MGKSARKVAASKDKSGSPLRTQDKRSKASVIEIGEHRIAPNQRRRVEIRVARLATETWLSLPIEVINGAHAGPRLWINAAIHGDELVGVECIRQVLGKIVPADLYGTIIAVPIVNVFGFVQQSRYLPDRRDLNRSFPGSPRGSLAARLAHLFLSTVGDHCSYGIDLHTGAHHRANFPQVRANLRDPETRRLAEAFGAPVVMHSETRDGSLRHAAADRGIHVLVYEGGEANRLDQEAIRIGVAGILHVLTELKMRRTREKKQRQTSIEVGDSKWVRARRGGILRLSVNLGESVRKGQNLAIIADAFGENPVRVKARHDGIIIGLTNHPLVNQGDAVIHVGTVASDVGTNS